MVPAWRPRHEGAWVFLWLVPVLAPFAFAGAELIRTPSAWGAWGEIDRVIPLLANSAALAALATVVALPAGAFLGVVLARGRFAGRQVLRCGLLLALFVPLPVTAVAWQIVFGSWIPPVALGPGAIAWRPWAIGLLPAAWVHGTAAVPWVAGMVMASLRYADATLEDEATMTGGTRALVRVVLVPRIVLALFAATGFVTAQTATEIAVTDAMMVRTYAEEIYTQLVGFPAGVAASVAVTVPVWIVVSFLASGIAHRLASRFFPPESSSIMGRSFHTRVAWLAWPLVGIIALLPIAALVWKAGTDAEGWQFSQLISRLSVVFRLSGGTLFTSFLAAVAAGLLTATIATRIAWQFRERAGFIVALAVILAFAPGPLAGLGLKETISGLLSLEESVLKALALSPGFPPLRSALYDQATPLPGIWAGLIRFLPVALAIIYPVVRGIPRELFDLARLDGGNAWRSVGWPATQRSFGIAALSVAALSFGEVSASKLVVPPQLNLAILDLFNQMHYGTESGVAAMGLLQLFPIALAGGLACVVYATQAKAHNVNRP